jgi:putative glutamine amidotransferase
MGDRPVIGISGRRKLGRQMAGFPASLGDLDLDVYVTDYTRGIIDAGGLPLHLPLDLDPAEYAELLDGVMLTGGTDIAPELYGQQRLSDEFPPEPERDAYELSIARLAIDAELPMLGVCRGMQLLNVLAGGSLHQHVPVHSRYDVPPDRYVHDVVLEPGSTAHELYGPSISVNSMHHQTIDRLGAGYRITGRSPDGVAESIESDDGLVVCVQWHPEVLPTRPTDPAFAWVVEQSAKRRRR